MPEYYRVGFSMTIKFPEARMSLEQQVVFALGLEDAYKADDGAGWQLWSYRLRDPASQKQLPDDFFLLFLGEKGFKKSEISNIRVKVGKKTGGRNLSVALQRSSSLATDRDAVKAEFRPASVMLLHELLQRECRRLLGNAQGEPEPVAYFIEPNVDGGPIGSDALAIRTLGRWLLAEPEYTITDRAEAPSLAVLLAPAGVGKTSVTRQLFRYFQLHRPDVLPLLIASRQWSSLGLNDIPSLWALIKHALVYTGHNVVTEQVFKTFAQAGCIIPIFDGLDEVGSIRDGSITPADIIAQLQELSENSVCRILLTSREGLWSEMVPLENRRRVHEFRLQPFYKSQIAKYRESRFPRPKDPARDRFDKILDALTKAAHPSGTGKTPVADRAPAAPLLLDLAATEAEQYEDGPKSYRLQGIKYRNPLYAITYGILNREYEVRNFPLSPAQQFMMIATLVENRGSGPYPLDQIREACEYALEDNLPEADTARLPLHAVFRPAGNMTFLFRFEYLMNFAPAVWLTDYLLNRRKDASVEKYLDLIAGRSSPVSAYVADLLRGNEWKFHIWEQARSAKQSGLSSPAVMPFLWELAQSLLPDMSDSSRAARMETMCEIFGEDKGRVFSNITFAGAIVYMDVRGIVFQNCVFQNCEWINCDCDATTEFRDCVFKGRFHQVSSAALGRAVFNPMGDGNTDDVALADLERLTGRRPRTNRDAVTKMLKSLLNEFQRGGYSIPRGQRDIEAMRLGPSTISKYMIETLLRRGVLENDESNRLRIVRSHSATVMALLDNASLRRSLLAVVDDVVKGFAEH
jgi:hypothetical protein